MEKSKFKHVNVNVKVDIIPSLLDDILVCRRRHLRMQINKTADMTTIY